MSDFTVLLVCSGNLCRSPIAQQVLRSRLAQLPGIKLLSAGTAADPRTMMPDQAVSLSISLGGDPRDHTPRLLEAEQISEAGLVLAMAREHRRSVVSLLPRASRFTFTLREFARLAGAVTDEEFTQVTEQGSDDTSARLATAVRLVATYRGMLPPVLDVTDDDIVDPFGRDDSGYQLAAEQLMPATEVVAAYLRRAATESAGARVG